MEFHQTHTRIFFLSGILAGHVYFFIRELLHCLIFFTFHSVVISKHSS